MSDRSLFIISLPRSLSSHIYQSCSRVLDLKQPSWTTEGEILNLDRFLLCSEIDQAIGTKYTLRRNNPDTFRIACEFLAQTVVTEGFIYKDVIQPFVVSAWLADQSMPVIRINRDVCDIAFSMLEKDWHYPAYAARDVTNLEKAVISGLLMARKAIQRVDAIDLHYDQIIFDEKPLADALSELYPRRDTARVIGFLDKVDPSIRDSVLKRRESARYLRLKELLATLC